MKIKLLFLGLAIAAIASSCSKKHDVNTVPPVYVSHPISKDTLSGAIKGTLLAGKTYYASGNLYVHHGDTLTAQPGAKLLFFGTGTAGSGSTYSLYCSGVLNFQGTKTSHVVLGTSAPNPTWPNGYWGGINCDSASTYVNLQWTDVSYTGGADTLNGNQYALSVLGAYPGHTFKSNTVVIVENCTFSYGYDDVMRFTGPIQISIRGNITRKEGGPDGDGISVKHGVIGDICYNYCWSGANNSIKSDEYSSDPTQHTHVNFYNNTIINGGWRKQGEESAGFKIGDYSQVSVFNNLIINCRNGLRIRSNADTTYMKGKYGNNYFYAAVDSVVHNFYPSYEWGRPQPTDIISTGPGNLDPLIVNFDPRVDAAGTGATVGGTIIYTDQNNPHLQPTSPAIGKGNTNAPTTNVGSLSKFMPGKDIGAFQSDGSGNQILN